MKIALLIYQYVNFSNSKFQNPQFKIRNPKSSTRNPQSAIPIPQSTGGVERQISDLSKAFVEIGHEVHIFCHKLKGTVDKNIIFHHVPAVGFWSPLKIWTFAIVSLLILRQRQNEFDIIHSFGKTLFQDVLRMGGGSHLDYMKRTYPYMRNPVLKFLIILNPRHFFNLLLEWAMFRVGKFKRVVCNSKMCKTEFTNRYNIPSSEIDVIYNGVDLQKFSPGNKKESRDRLNKHISSRFNIQPERELLVLFVGSGFKRKGLKHAVKSLSFVDKRHDIRLVVAGRGRFAGYKKLADNLGVSDQITYLGVVDNVKELYDACDISIFPTEYDAFGNVCLEAMAMELPVIVSSSSGASEIVDDDLDGFVLDYPIEAQKIAQKIEFLTDKRKRVEIGKLARKKALNYSVQSNAETTLKLYEEIRNQSVT
ncbi:MAG: glycosyltransferase family 4 protein [Candidatus Anammoxibacter sp.]